MNSRSIKYCAVGEIANGGRIKLQECLDVTNLLIFEKEANTVLKNESRQLIYQDNRVLKKDISSGSLYYKPTQNGELVFFLLAKPTYSFGRAMQLIAEIEHIYANNEEERSQSNSIYECLKSYDLNAGDDSDKLGKARSTIDSITSSVKGNIESVMKNSSQLGDIESKSKSLSDSSRGFLDQSRKIEEQIRSRRRRMYYIIGGILAFILLFIIIFFIL